MIKNKLYVSILPLLLIVLTASLSYSNSDVIEIESSTEINIDQELMNSLINQVGKNIPTCTASVNNISNESNLSCPCGGHCKADPGNVCTLCSEWSTQEKFVPCPKEGEDT